MFVVEEITKKWSLGSKQKEADLTILEQLMALTWPQLLAIRALP